jgi:hypothetical protein
LCWGHGIGGRPLWTHGLPRPGSTSRANTV